MKKRPPKTPFGDLTEDPSWLETSRPAFLVCIFFTLLFFFFFLVIFLFVPVLHTDPYVEVADAPALLDDDDHHEESMMARSEPSTVGLRQVVLPSQKNEWVLRMPYPRGVDSEIMDENQPACANFSLFTCGKWKGHGESWVDRSFGSAQRDAHRRLEMVLGLESSQYSSERSVRDERSIGGGGAFHDAVFSCVGSALYPNESSDLNYAHATLKLFEPSPKEAEGKDASFLGGYATGVAIVYGDKPGLGVDMTMNPLDTRESLVEFGISQQVMSFFLLTQPQIDHLLDAACRTLMAVEMFPWDRWSTQLECARDFRGLVSALITQTQQADRTSPAMNTDYIFHRMKDDIYSSDDWRELVGESFMLGLEAGMKKGMETFGPVLEQEGLAMPDLGQLRKWSRYLSLVQWIASTSGQPSWVPFVRAMFVMGNYQYESSILTSDNIGSIVSRDTHVRSHGLPLHTLSDELNGADMRMWRISRAHPTRLPHPNHLKKKEQQKVARQSMLGDDPLTLSALQRSDLWRRCAWLSMEYFPAEVDNSVARMAVKPDARARVHQITDMIVQAMSEDIRASEVISDEGKAAILNKLSHVRARVAVPWDLDGEPPLSVPYDVDASGSFVRNMRQARARNTIQGLIEGVRSHGRAPTERPNLSHTFQMPTSAVNAYYDPTSNQIFFMVGILTPPFFSLDYGDATQLATLGAIIGHELSHAFDSMGKMFTAEGNLGSFLPKEVQQHWADAEHCFVEQYSDVKTPLGNHVNGEQTLGENMADVMGLRAAYRALFDLHKGEGDVPKEVKKEFVEAYAQMWCSAVDKNMEAERSRTDVHAPGAARIQGALRNLVDPNGKHVLEQIYGCATGDAMHPEEICSVW